MLAGSEHQERRWIRTSTSTRRDEVRWVKEGRR
jgi:hypothetical protein